MTASKCSAGRARPAKGPALLLAATVIGACFGPAAVAGAETAVTHAGAQDASSAHGAGASYWRPVEQANLSSACRSALDGVRDELQALPTTALMAARGRDVLLSYGRIDRPSIVYSVRKSILSMLYGRQVAEGRIRLDETLGDLGIDDVGGLLPIERQARVRDLLTARSGVFHAAANPGDDATAAPARGSQQPGSYFLYNNWDFNVTGSVFEQRTGRSLYQTFDADIAQPLGLQDFDLSRHRRTGDARRSVHLAYHFHLSARDMARIGQLMLAGGAWQGRQVVPAAWVAESTAPVTAAAAMHPPHVARRGLGYGYLWWLPEVPETSPLAGSYFAWGYYGQFILVVPRRGLVIVHKHDIQPAEGRAPRHVRVPAFLAIAARLADAPCEIPPAR